MSRIADLGDKFAQLPDVLAEYEADLKGVEGYLNIKGKTVESANMENPTWLSFYDQKRSELKTLVDYMNMEVERVRGKLYRAYKENHSRELGEREINQYINNEEAYLSRYQLYLEVKEMHTKFQAAVDAFISRGYSLNNITKVRVAAIESDIL